MDISMLRYNQKEGRKHQYTSSFKKNSTYSNYLSSATSYRQRDEKSVTGTQTADDERGLDRDTN